LKLRVAGSGRYPILPTDKTSLEREMQALGVAPKQTDKAPFIRSAEQAGFLAHGEDRLVLPAVGALPLTKPNHSEWKRDAQLAKRKSVPAKWANRDFENQPVLGR
jgi:hypothetical protein